MVVGDHNITGEYQAGSVRGPFDGVSPVLVETIKSASPIIIIGGNKRDFTISITQPSAEVVAGQTFTTQVTLTPVNGLTGPIMTICADSPPGSTCTLTPDTGTLDGKNPITATVAISTTGSAISATSLPGTGNASNDQAPFLALGFLPLALAISLVSTGERRKRRMLMFPLLVCLLAGCGGT